MQEEEKKNETGLNQTQSEYEYDEEEYDIEDPEYDYEYDDESANEDGVADFYGQSAQKKVRLGNKLASNNKISSRPDLAVKRSINASRGIREVNEDH